MFRHSLVVLVLTSCAVDVASAINPHSHLELTRGLAAEVDMDVDQIQKATSIIRYAVEDGEIPGAVILVARRGRVILHEAYGFRDQEQTIPLEKKSLFRMASNSKAITATGIMLLAQQGKLELDQPVGTYLPAFKNKTWQPITVRHLLTHTSGIRIKPLFLTPLLEKSDKNPQAPDLRLEVNRFADIAPEQPPGKTYSYNNAGYNTLAAIIEQLTGSYKQYLRTQIYEPLGMRDSCNHEPDADHDRMVTVLKRQTDGSWVTGWKPGDPPDWPFPRGSGGMVSSAWDYALFCQMLLHQGRSTGTQILTPESVEEMTNPQSDHCEAATNYGLGWKVSERGGVFSHTGSDGTYVWVDPTKDLIGMVLTQTNATTRPRSAFRQLIQRACTDNSQTPNRTVSQPRSADGFYKDIFMSSGKNLTSRKVLHAAESLSLQYEYYAGSDAWWQNQLLIGSLADQNGALVYPDGQPRFRMLYVNGGGATSHGKSLTKDGRERIRSFYHAGGSYCGSCAGSFLSGRNVDARPEPRLGYLHFFPYNTLNTGIKKTKVNHRIPMDSPLLRYRDFGRDYLVPEVYHNNGNWLNMDEAMSGVEVLAKYDHPGHKVDGGAAIWAYRSNEQAGRVVNIGCHPEGSSEGKKLALTEACFLHALAGTGKPQVKTVLTNGESRCMVQSSNDNQPGFSMIGDHQYHHFAFDVTADQPRISIELTSEKAVDLHLFLAEDTFAFRNQASLVDIRPGASKTLLRTLKPGRWYIGVYCATGVETINDPESGFYRHIGDRSILNGVPYQIQVESQAMPPNP